MLPDFEFLTPADRPALLGLSHPQYIETARAALTELGYKVHTALSHGDFLTRFSRIQYQVVLIEDYFDTLDVDQNLTLQTVQSMQMHQRRHAVILLLGSAFQTLQPLQAFAQSVHAVVNPADLDNLTPIIQQVVSDNDLFLHAYRDAMLHVARNPV